MAKPVDLDVKVAKFSICSGVGLLLAVLIGQLFILHFVPPPSPSLSAEYLRDMFRDRSGAIQLGAVIILVGWTFWLPWAMSINLFVRKMERGYPFLAYSAIAMICGSFAFFLLVPISWSVAAYRADVTDPQIIQTMVDFSFWCFLYAWPPFTLWLVIVGIAILRDHHVPTLYPRWMAYLLFWCAFLLAPAALMGFFKDGPFAYDGIATFWLPVSTTFLWMGGLSVYSFKAINRIERDRLAGIETGAPIEPDPVSSGA